MQKLQKKLRDLLNRPPIQKLLRDIFNRTPLRDILNRAPIQKLLRDILNRPPDHPYRRCRCLLSSTGCLLRSYTRMVVAVRCPHWYPEIYILVEWVTDSASYPPSALNISRLNLLLQMSLEQVGDRHFGKKRRNLLDILHHRHTRNNNRHPLRDIFRRDLLSQTRSM